MDEVIAQVRSNGGEYRFVYSCLGNETVFENEPTLAELCRRMLEFESFRSRVKEMKPWGKEEILVIPYSWNKPDGGVENDFIVLVYQETE